LEKDVRELVKSRFTKVGLLDSWAMHCATRAGIIKESSDQKAKRFLEAALGLSAGEKA
jgi:hypothetical protein